MSLASFADGSPHSETVDIDFDDKTPIDAASVDLIMATALPREREPSQPRPAVAAGLVVGTAPHDRIVMGTPKGFPNPPAMVRGEQSSPAPHAGMVRGGMALRRLPWLARALSDAESALQLLADAFSLYRRNFKSVALLACALLLPVTAVKSCMVATVAGSGLSHPLSEDSATTLDFARVKQELGHRIETSRAAGRLDKAAQAELAALESVAAVGETTVAAEPPSETATSARRLGAILLTGLLLIGLAVPLAHATMNLVAVNQAAGVPLPAVMDVCVLLWRQRLRFLTALLPAALLVAVGSALFVLPGLIAAALFLFAPAVVFFERAMGKTALLRSMALVKTDAVRVVVVMLAACVLGAAAYTLADLVMPAGGLRFLVFGRALVGDLLMVLCLPVPALTVARLYIDLRSCEGVDAAELAQASRR